MRRSLPPALPRPAAKAPKRAKDVQSRVELHSRRGDATAGDKAKAKAPRHSRALKVLHVVVFQFAGTPSNPVVAEAFRSKRRANRFMAGGQYGVIARRVQVEVPWP